MTITRDPLRTIEYVTEEDRKLPPEERTIWTLGVLTARQNAAIVDGCLTVTRKGAVTEKAGSMQLATLAFGLRGAKNLLGPDGKEIQLAWEAGPAGPRIADETLDAIPMNVRIELFGQITRLNRFNGTDAKN